MAFFRFRKSSAAETKASSRVSAAATAETVQTLRRRARHRLVGAAVLVLLAVIGFPLLFDTEPRPVVVDAPITIPDRETAPPLKAPATTPAPAQTQAQPQSRTQVEAPAAAKTDASGPDATAAAPTHSPPASVPVTATAAEEAARSKRVAEAQAQREHEARARRDAETARAQALLEGRSPPKPAAKAETGRFIVQIGAFADDEKVHEVRRKVEHAGLKTFTQIVETPAGKRTRVRVGSFASRAEAEKAAETLQQIGLPGKILSL